MVMIFVVDSEQMNILGCEFSTASGTDPRVDSQGLLPVSSHAFIFRLPGPSYELIHFPLTDPTSARSF